MPSVAAQAAGLTSSQYAMAQVIEREFEAAGFGPPVIKAAIINAIAESGLNPNAVGDGGKSVGLFQLHEKGGGHGMSVSERKDPSLNTRRIIQQAKKARGFMGLVNDGETSVGKLTAAFTIHVERPANKTAQGAKRAAMVARYFPGVVGTFLVTEAKGMPWWVWALGAVSVGVALWGAYGVIRHRR